MQEQHCPDEFTSGRPSCKHIHGARAMAFVHSWASTFHTCSHINVQEILARDAIPGPAGLMTRRSKHGGHRASSSNFKHAESPPRNENQPKTDLYAVLGLERTASNDDIRRAYKQLALKHHPVSCTFMGWRQLLHDACSCTHSQFLAGQEPG